MSQQLPERLAAKRSPVKTRLGSEQRRMPADSNGTKYWLTTTLAHRGTTIPTQAPEWLSMEVTMNAVWSTFTTMTAIVNTASAHQNCFIIIWKIVMHQLRQCMQLQKLTKLSILFQQSLNVSSEAFWEIPPKPWWPRKMVKQKFKNSSIRYTCQQDILSQLKYWADDERWLADKLKKAVRKLCPTSSSEPESRKQLNFPHSATQAENKFLAANLCDIETARALESHTSNIWLTLI